ncbi:hypothetical protein WMY93_018790 [Mugilogobius chulae]|uniref:LIM domain binding 3a n=1 Tax=Mugilogobius chulae TaxID=88201 RepID=A0AAW0NRT7_9GOBI
MPLTISRITPGSKAALGNLIQGDVIVAIDGVSTDGMTHLEAQNKIKMANYNLALTMSKSKRPVQLAAPRMDAAPIPMIPHQQCLNKHILLSGHLCLGLSSIAGQDRFIAPFCPGGLKDPAHRPIEVTGPGGKATIIHAQYNTPISMYSQDSIMDAIAGQTQAKGQDMGLVPVRESLVDSSSPVYQAVHCADRDPELNEWGRRSTSSLAQSRSFQALVHMTGTDSADDDEEEELHRCRYEAVTCPPLKTTTTALPSPPTTTILPSPVPAHSNCPSLSLSVWPHIHTSTVTGPTEHAPVPCAVSVCAQPAAAESSACDPQSPYGPPPAMYQAPQGPPPQQYQPMPQQYQQPLPPQAPPTQQSSIQIPLGPPLPKWSARPASTPPNQHLHQRLLLPRPILSPAPLPLSLLLPPLPPPPPIDLLGRTSSSQPSGHPSSPAPITPSPAPFLPVARGVAQRAERFAASSRTPLCGACNSIIRGPFLVALGRSWHPEEFNCHYCHMSLADVSFVEEQNNVYCENCYEEFFAPTSLIVHLCENVWCVLQEVMHALRQTWHTTCFVCAACGKPFGNSLFHMEDGEPYCEKDYIALFSTKCHGCDFPVEAGDKFIEALGHTWHDTCFVCAVCHVNLEGQPFYSKKDKPLCKKHAHAINV